MKTRALAAALVLLSLSGRTSASGRYLRSGPMVGYSEPKEVLLWVQTNAPVKVKFAYWEEATPGERHETAETVTLKQDGYIAKLIADEVEPGKRYQYELLIDGETVARDYPLRFQARPVTRGFRGPGAPPGPPTAPRLRIAAGSCYYANDPADPQGWNPGAEYPIFESIRQKQPDLMLWLGDNVYTRDIDWTTRTGMLQRYAFGRAVKELQPLLGSVHHYAIWDDHDYGPNDADRSYRDKEIAREVFQLFWGNPAFGVPGKDGTRGVNYRFSWADAEFFLLDNRWNRSPNMRIGGRRQVLGEEQIEWLLDSLASSNAAFKIVVMGGQVLNPARVAETYANYPEEREELLRRLAAERVRGVFFLTGDRHYTDLSKLERKGTYPLYDFTVSPLTVSPANGEREPNTLRVPGSYVQERNFGTLDVKGPFGNRELVLSVWSSRGELKWTRTISQRELRDPEE